MQQPNNNQFQAPPNHTFTGTNLPSLLHTTSPHYNSRPALLSNPSSSNSTSTVSSTCPLTLPNITQNGSFGIPPVNTQSAVNAPNGMNHNALTRSHSVSGGPGPGHFGAVNAVNTNTMSPQQQYQLQPLPSVTGQVPTAVPVNAVSTRNGMVSTGNTMGNRMGNTVNTVSTMMGNINTVNVNGNTVNTMGHSTGNVQGIKLNGIPTMNTVNTVNRVSMNTVNTMNTVNGSAVPYTISSIAHQQQQNPVGHPAHTLIGSVRGTAGAIGTAASNLTQNAVSRKRARAGFDV